MPSELRQELNLLLQEQARLRGDLAVLEKRTAALSARLEGEALPALPGQPPPLPAVRVRAGEAVPATDVESSSGIPAEAVQPTASPEPLPARSAPARGSLEMQLGTVWLARIGIVVLLTGLVFLGNYAWQNLQLGAAGKVGLLLMAGGTLAGLGEWLRRRPVTATFGQVMIAGGAATVYYTTYAAHFVSSLQVMEGPLIGGGLLLTLGALYVWIADRLRSRTAAVLTLLLTYYTAAINPVGEFTLFSNVLLTAAGLLLLLRHGWAAVSWAGLAGTYASYGFWEWHRSFAEHGLRAEPTLLLALGFLTVYWLFFTAATFLSRPTAFNPASLATFATLNNAAFLAYALYAVRPFPSSFYGNFCLGFGAVLLLLAAAAWRWRPERLALDAVFLVQGVGVFTAGMALKLSGPSLAVVLAVEALVLVSGAGRRHGWIFEWLARAAALWSTGLVLDRYFWDRPALVPEALPVAALSIGTAVWLKVRRGELPAMKFVPRAAYFALLGLLLAAPFVADRTPFPWAPASMLGLALIGTALVYLARLPELPCLSAGVAAGGLAWWWWEAGGSEASQAPGRAAWPVAAVSLALAIWWYRQRLLAVRGEIFASFYWLVGWGTVGVWPAWYLDAQWRAPYYAGFFLLLALLGLNSTASVLRATALAFGGITFIASWCHLTPPPLALELVSLILVPAIWSMLPGSAHSPFVQVRAYWPSRTAPVPSWTLNARSLLAAPAVFSVWLWVTRWSCAYGHSRSLTVAWSLLALIVFAVGLGVRERVYRVGGFLVLALALGRIFTVDVWRLETIYRFVSALSLGGVLLLLGFLYNRFSETIRRWL